MNDLHVCLTQGKYLYPLKDTQNLDYIVILFFFKYKFARVITAEMSNVAHGPLA